VEVTRARPEPEMPDAVFVEDTAVVADEVAVMTRTGAESRRGEVGGVAEILGRFRKLCWMTEPGTLDGGDVLRIGKTVYVGQTPRSNAEGLGQLAKALEPHGYRLVPVAVRGCLHLKSAVTQVAEDAVVLNPAWVSAAVFGGVDVIAIDPAEPYAGNGLLVNGHLIYPSHFPGTCERLIHRGVKVLSIPCDELAKAEGAVSCCSILVPRVVQGTEAV